jgi:hypothetical protein
MQASETRECEDRRSWARSFIADPLMRRDPRRASCAVHQSCTLNITAEMHSRMHPERAAKVRTLWVCARPPPRAYPKLSADTRRPDRPRYLYIIFRLISAGVTAPAAAMNEESVCVAPAAGRGLLSAATMPRGEKFDSADIVRCVDRSACRCASVGRCARALTSRSVESRAGEGAHASGSASSGARGSVDRQSSLRTQVALPPPSHPRACPLRVRRFDSHSCAL